MARWRLTEPHYLKVDGIFWEHNQIDRKTGKPKRVQYVVPLFLDPKSIDDLIQYGQMDPAIPSNDAVDWMIVVVQGDSPVAKDVRFHGEPTPGMLPLDDEARAISEKHSKGIWKPTEGVDEDSQRNSYSNKVIGAMLDKLDDLKVVASGAQVGPDMTEFMQTMQAMMKQQTDILAMLAQNQGKAGGQGPRSVMR